MTGRCCCLILTAVFLAACVPVPAPDSTSVDQPAGPDKTPVPVVQEPQADPEPADDIDSCIKALVEAAEKNRVEAAHAQSTYWPGTGTTEVWFAVETDDGLSGFVAGGQLEDQATETAGRSE